MADLIVVDDNEDVRDAITEFLRMDGHEVRTAEDGYGGLQLLGERFPDVALLDVEMPELTGPEMAYRMFVDDCGRERIPIVFLSGVVGLEQIALQVGTTYYLRKPFGLKALREVVAKALEERAAPTYTSWQAEQRARVERTR